MAPLLAALLAHQDGWDELLMVLTPIVIFAGMLFMANKRAAAKVAADAADAATAEPSAGEDERLTP